MKKEPESKPEKKPEKKASKKSYRERKCKCCHEMFMPQPHNAYHQRFCTAPFCRFASKRESARRYRNKQRKNRNEEENKSEVIRVQNWRKGKPGYSRNTTRSFQFSLSIRLLPALPNGREKKILVVVRRRKGRALQDLYIPKRPDRRAFSRDLNRALRDLYEIFPGTWYPSCQKPRKRSRGRIFAFR
jgi:hypothetical protein